MSALLGYLSKVDPNVAIALITGGLAFLYHHLFSPSTQAKIAADTQSTLSTALEIADKVMGALVAAAPKGTTRADLQAQLWTAAKVQLQHIGLDPDQLPDAVKAAAQALVDKYLATTSSTASSSPKAASA